jgi:uncharacterized protein (TIGR02145 family)
MKAIKLLLILYAGILLHCSNEFPRIHYTPKEDTNSGVDLCKEKEREGSIDEGYYCNPQDGEVRIDECKKKNVSYDINEEFCDVRDGQVYKYKLIGTQIWMAQNLNYTIRGYGETCYQEELKNCEIYGMLYNFETAMKACPPGWHLSTDDEWLILTEYVKSANPGLKLPSYFLKADDGWYNNDNGDNTYGFSALPGGYYAGQGDAFNDVEKRGSWWMANNLNDEISYYIYYNGQMGKENPFGKGYYRSVRCVKNQDY